MKVYKSLIKCDFNNPKKKRMYLTLSPCPMCAKAIINDGIGEVVYADEYRDKSGVILLQRSNILVRQYT
jgi:dCMP deaminase